MATAKTLSIEVVYARPDQQRVITLEVAAGCTIESAIHQSGILTIFPEIDLAQQPVGIFSKIRELSDVLTNGDRIEIYRPLLVDPKTARRVKARKARVARLAIRKNSRAAD